MRNFDPLFDELRALVVSLYGTGVQPVTVSVKLSDGRKLSLPIAAPRNLSDTGSLKDQIIELLRAVGHRLTQPQIKQRLEEAGTICSDSTMRHKLPEMVEDGELNQRQDTRPRGYGLPEWGTGDRS